MPNSAALSRETDAERFVAAWETFAAAIRRARSRAAERPDGMLTPAQFRLLAALEDAPSLSVGELAQEAGVSSPTATRMLDGLVRDGYAQRTPCDEDRRAVLVSLTPRGEQALHARWARLRERLEHASTELTAAEREQATQLLRRLAELMDEI